MTIGTHRKEIEERLGEIGLARATARLEGWDLGMRQAALMAMGKAKAMRGTRGPVSPHLDSLSRMILKEAENHEDYDEAPTFPTQRKPKNG